MNNNINFSFVAIMKNERNVLPRLFDSVQHLLDAGVDFSILDTGSTDDSVTYARSRGAQVIEVGEMFLESITEELANSINITFAKDNKDIVKPNQKLFNFAAARNHITKYAKHDFVFTLDCDEAYSVFNTDIIIDAINNGIEQFEYQFVYAHDQNGNAAVQFIQSKAFDRRKKLWVGKVHEVLQDYLNPTNIQYMSEEFIKLEHWQEQGKDHRSNYLTGLALDCYLNQNNDRNSHYLARELMYEGMYISAITEFKRHIEMDAWQAEKAQSMIYVGDCYGYLGDSELQRQYYVNAFSVDPTRREALIKLAFMYRGKKKWQEVAVFASAALQVSWNSYYANDRSMYEHVPHELLYEAQGWLGNTEGAKSNLWECLKYQPYNPKYLHDTRFFFEYPSSMIDGWMTFEEQTFLYNTAKKYNGGLIVEVGSWKGRSACALATGNKDGILLCIDTWKGSEEVLDHTNFLAKQEDIFDIFKDNTKQFTNIKTIRTTSVEGAENFEDGSIDAVFIDAGHRYQDVIDDLAAWIPKVKKGGIILGHDYSKTQWMRVVEAVDDTFGKPDEVHDTIWVKYIN